MKVKVELDTEVTPELVTSEKPDVVIIATGAEPAIPDTPGVKNKNVVRAIDVLGGKVELKNQSVVIAGGGMIGTEVGEYLLDRGNKVTLVEMLPTIAADMEPLNRMGLMEALEGRDITMMTNKEAKEINEKSVIVTDRRTGKQQSIEGDTVVVALGSKSVSSLAEELAGKVPELYTVGDCNEPRRLEQAIYEGSLIARRI